MDRQTQKAVRDLSKRLFEARYRLEVGAAIADCLRRGERFCNKNLADALGSPPGPNGVSNELKKLKAAGLIEIEGGGDRTKYLRARRSGYWEACLELRDQAQELVRRSGP
jgi:hypothetical protein